MFYKIDDQTLRHRRLQGKVHEIDRSKSSVLHRFDQQQGSEAVSPYRTIVILINS
jgi:hypothetical protein